MLPDPPLGVGYTSLASSIVDSWHYNGADEGLYEGVTHIAGQPAPTPIDGGQAAYIYGGGGGLYQLLNVTAGHTYTVNAVMAGSSTAQVALLIQTSSSDIFLTPSAPPPYYTSLTNSSFANYTYQFTAAASGVAAIVVDASGPAYVFLSSVSITDNAPVPPLSGLLVASAVAANTNFATTAGGVAGIGGTGTGDGTIELQVVNTGASIAAQETFINSATGAISVSPTLLAPNATSTLFDNVEIATGNFSSPDVGVTSYIKIGQNVPPVVGLNPGLEVQSGADEGAVLNVALPAVSTSMLRISNVNVLSSFGGNPSLAAEDAIGQIDQALQTLLTQRAQLGAFMVRLSVDASNDNVTGVNLQASESNIRDANISQMATAFTADQILSSIGTSVLANIKTQASLVEKLFQ